MTIWWFLGPALALCVLVVGLIALGLARGARVRASSWATMRSARASPVGWMSPTD